MSKTLAALQKWHRPIMMVMVIGVIFFGFLLPLVLTAFGIPIPTAHLDPLFWAFITPITTAYYIGRTVEKGRS
jgi:hypothetical protein